MAFQQGLSGLNATSRALEVIGNNIANANTFGFKAARAEFADMYAAALNGSGANSVGIGVRLAAVAQQFTQGNISVTENSLDLAINGGGFFQLGDRSGGPPVFSRNGQFKVDREGFIVNHQGLRLLGNGSDPLRMDSGALSDPLATTASEAGPMRLDFNLNAAAGSAHSGPFDPRNPSTYNNATSMTVYDAQGAARALTFFFRQSSVANEWEVHAQLDGAAVGTGPVTTLEFDTSGLKTSPSTNVDLSILGGTVPVNFNATQFAAPFAVTHLEQGGRAPGTPVSMTIEPDGQLLVRYTNGLSLAAGQIELVNFRNPQGLQPLGGNVWASTFASGTVSSRGAPGSSNLGLIQAGALEDSNVDLTAQLVHMISAQRMYQANAQTIKTMDQALQSIVNLR